VWEAHSHLERHIELDWKILEITKKSLVCVCCSGVYAVNHWRDNGLTHLFCAASSDDNQCHYRLSNQTEVPGSGLFSCHSYLLFIVSQHVFHICLCCTDFLTICFHCKMSVQDVFYKAENGFHSIYFSLWRIVQKISSLKRRSKITPHN